LINQRMTIDRSQTHRKVIFKEVDKSVDLRVQLGTSENRRKKNIERTTEMLAAKESQY